MIFGLLRKGAAAAPSRAEAVHAAVVAAARRPRLYLAFGAPDTLPGRFELIVLHATLLLRRLRLERSPDIQAFGQEVFDAMFRALDDNLREIGVGDVSVPKRVKTMARSYFDGAKLYDAALDAGDAAALAAALERIVYRGPAIAPPGAPQRFAAYVIEADKALAAQPIADVMRAGPIFPPIPEGA